MNERFNYTIQVCKEIISFTQLHFIYVDAVTVTTQDWSANSLELVSFLTSLVLFLPRLRHASSSKAQVIPAEEGQCLYFRTTFCPGVQARRPEAVAQGAANASVKGRLVRSSGFTGHTISAPATQLCLARQKQPQTVLSDWEWLCANKTHFTKTGGGCVGPRASVSSPRSGVPAQKEMCVGKNTRRKREALDVCASPFLHL